MVTSFLEYMKMMRALHNRILGERDNNADNPAITRLLKDCERYLEKVFCDLRDRYGYDLLPASEEYNGCPAYVLFNSLLDADLAIQENYLYLSAAKSLWELTGIV